MTPEKGGEDISPGVWLFAPGEKVPNDLKKVEPPEPVHSPLDAPPAPPVRLVGRRRAEVGEGGS